MVEDGNLGRSQYQLASPISPNSNLRGVSRNLQHLHDLCGETIGYSITPCGYCLRVLVRGEEILDVSRICSANGFQH